MTGIYDGEWVVSSLIEDRAERLGDRHAVSAPGGDLTYAELRDRAASVAAALRTLGVEPGDRVLTMLDPSLDYLAAWFGVMWAGGVDVPVNTDFKGAFLERVAGQSGAKVMVIDGRWAGRLEDVELPELRHVVVVGDAGVVPSRLNTLRFSDALAHDRVPRARRDELDLAYLMYTSGTTGPSKGVMLTNRGALWNVRAWIDLLSLTADDVAYSMFPLFHVTARSAVVTSAIWAGGSIALRHGFSASGFWDDVRASSASYFAYMGAVIHLLWAQEPRPDDRDNRLRVAFGAAAPAHLVDPFQERFGVKLIEVYGSTELGLATAPEPGRERRGTTGVVQPHFEIEIHDERGRRVAPRHAR